MDRVRVVVADDDDAMREAMVEALEADGGFEVVCALASGRDLDRVVRDTRADLVLLDVRMSGGGAPAARALGALTRRPVVVAVSASTDTTNVLALVRAGATGYLAKGQLADSFTHDVARCARGQVVIAVPGAAQLLREAFCGGRSASGGAPLPHA